MYESMKIVLVPECSGGDSIEVSTREESVVVAILGESEDDGREIYLNPDDARALASHLLKVANFEDPPKGPDEQG